MCWINVVVLTIVAIASFLSYLAIDGYFSYREERYAEYEYAQQQKQDEYAKRLAEKHARFEEQYINR